MPMDHLGYPLTHELSMEAYKRDKAELLDAFSPQYVTISEERTPPGCLGLLKITVNSKGYILTSEEDTAPKLVDKPYFFMKVFDGYPAIAPRVYFLPNRRLAHVNTYRNGTQCIDKWGYYSSLKSAAEKTIRAIIYDENVTKYNSPACSSVGDWQKIMTDKKVFPLINPPDLILKAETGLVPSMFGPAVPPPLPGRRPDVEPKRAPLPPPLPRRQ